MEKGKIAAFGEKDIMLIFKSAGVDVFPVSGNANVPEMENHLKTLVSEGYSIIFMTETIAGKLDRLIKYYSGKITPSIVVIPGPGRSSQYAIRELRRAIIKAVGADVMAEEKTGIK
ncbi:MAG: hypothetical protein JW770_07530 [Actinobacteria bacterium]|nr:hypothetical protein [Actinomycetota bacterium]